MNMVVEIKASPLQGSKKLGLISILGLCIGNH